jgi:hypothetical protein
MKLLHLACLIFLHGWVTPTPTVRTEAPVCHPSDRLEADGSCRGAAEWTCPIWDYDSGWVLSGRSLARNDVVPGLTADLMIPWRQHTTRAFPRWGRHHYFFRNPLSDRDTDYIFAPGYKYPLECHKHFANLAVNYTDVFRTVFGTEGNIAPTLNPPIRTDRTIAIGDPIFLPCVDPTVSAKEGYEKFPHLEMTAETLQSEAEYCLSDNDLLVKEIEPGYFGTFASQDIKDGFSVTWGQFAYMHQAELMDPETQEAELLLNYCYAPGGGNSSSPILFLPFAPGATTFNHADPQKNQTPNARIMWMDPRFQPFRFFSYPSGILFGDDETNDGRPFMVEYVATRSIQAGEEILLDYGADWQAAYDTHRKQNGDVSRFRYPIGLPDDMIPAMWLKLEKTTEVASLREWLVPKLDAGELRGMELNVVETEKSTDTRQISGMVDRVGLPDGLADYMAKWADEMGITEVLRAHVRRELTLPPEGERRLRLNGTTWWVKRFPDDWRSDMHYISPDDFGSNQMFMEALAAAGYDTVLDSVGKRDNLTSITVYYPSYIAVSHCTRSMMHNDSEEDGHYNVIFPVLQVNNSKPELIVGDKKEGLYAPYKYESDYAVVLGNGGLHGTAPCDYRGTDSMRMVVSVYMVDSDNRPTREKIIREWIDADPPYPRVPDREAFMDSTKHWKRDDPTRSLRNPLLPKETSNDVAEE